MTAKDNTALLWPSAVCVQMKGELFVGARPVKIEMIPRSFCGGVDVWPPANLVNTLASVDRNIFLDTEGEAGGV